MPSRRPARSAHNKIRSPRALASILRRARGRRRLVFTNGCFDVLHAGHVRLLEFAKRQGDVLVVAINSDRSARRVKGPGRPVMSQRDRTLILAGLESVDYVTVFDARTPERLIARYRPDVLVKGADWRRNAIVGRETVERGGGRVVRAPFLAGRSSSRFIHQIRGRGR